MFSGSSAGTGVETPSCDSATKGARVETLTPLHKLNYNQSLLSLLSDNLN